MKLLNVLAVFAFIAVAKGAVNITSCKFCENENVANCTAMNVRNCSDNTFPNIGTTRCYTAAAYYMKDGNMKSGVTRGCSNYTVNAAYFKMKFDAHFTGANLAVATFNIQYCDNANNCNDQTVSPSTTKAPPGATVTTTTTSHATRLFPIIGIVAFVAIILAVTL